MDYSTINLLLYGVIALGVVVVFLAINHIMRH